MGSLNECLSRGPIILEDMCTLLLRFRTKRIGIIADIEKGFLQVRLQEQHRDVTRFLWIKGTKTKEINNNLETYRFTRIPFGIIFSSFLLKNTIRHHHHLGEYNSTIALEIKDDIYVDNLVMGTDCEEDAINLYTELKQIFQNASIYLREWISSSQKVNENRGSEDRLKDKVLKVLGIVWNTVTDDIQISMKQIDSIQPATTKREVLAATMSTFDPLGWFTPSTIVMKIFLQELWEKSREWDEKMSDDEIKRWKEIIGRLDYITDIHIPRFVGNGPAQLLCFCDASNKVYETAIYLRNIFDGTVNLLFSKARNAPKRKTIYHTKTQTFVSVNWSKKSSFCHKDTEN